MNNEGALAEFTGRMSKAVAAYRRALVILEEQGATLAGGLGASTEGSKKGDEDEVTHTHPRWADAVDVVTRNLARALARQGQAEEAVRVHENLDPVSKRGMASKYCILRHASYVRRYGPCIYVQSSCPFSLPPSLPRARQTDRQTNIQTVKYTDRHST